MPIKLGSVTVNPPGIESVYWGSYLVYLAGKLLTISGTSPLSLVNALAKPIQSLTQYGKCVQNNTPTPSAPADILCNNGVIKYGTINILDPTTVSGENKYIAAGSGSTSTPGNGTFRHSEFIPVKSGMTYKVGMTYYQAAVAGLAWYGDADTSTYVSGYSGTQINSANGIVTAPANAKYLRFSWRIDSGYDTDWEHSVYLCECKNGVPVISEWQAYNLKIYTEGNPETLTVSALEASDQNATVQNLYSVYDREDEQDLVNGIITRNIGVKVLNGTDSIAVVDGTFRINLTGKEVNTKVLCTHFNGDIDIATSRVNMPDLSVLAHRTNTFVYIRYNEIETVEDFNAYLVAQYNAGTPVIILYPLATSVTEQVTPQVLSTSEGSNTVTVTSNVDPVELKVEAWFASSAS